MQKHAANARVISLRSTNYYPPLKSNYYRNKIKWYAKKSPGNTGFSGFVALFRYSVKLSFAELRTLDFTELFGGLKSFRINNTLKLSALQFSFCWCLKSFRINKTLKLSLFPSDPRLRLKSFRINKTLKLHSCPCIVCFCLKSFRINKTLKPTLAKKKSPYCLKSFRINKTLTPFIKA